jgi:hypothetical protein
MAPHAPNTSDLGGLVPLTDRQFAPFSGTRVGARFWRRKRSEPGSVWTGAEWRTGYSRLEGEKWQRP